MEPLLSMNGFDYAFQGWYDIPSYAQVIWQPGA